MKRLSVALVLIGAAAFASGCAGGSSATQHNSGHLPALGAVDGILVELGGGSNGGGLESRHPLAHHSFVVSPVSGGVYKITTNAMGQFHFRGRPGVYYPVAPTGFGDVVQSSGLTRFRVVAGKTTRVVIDVGANWKAVSAS
jgi:hypothetical protein